MNARRRIIHAAALASVLCSSIALARVDPVGNSFTYQGLLKQEGAGVTGLVDMNFRLFDAPTGGNEICCVNSYKSIPVENGLFTIEIEFVSNAFGSQARWLQIEVRSPHCFGCPDYVTLSPRQKVTPAPLALAALAVDGAAISNLCAEQITCGTLDPARLPLGGDWNVAGPLIITDNLLTIDGVNGRVGVGTASPLPRFEVRGMEAAASAFGNGANGITRMGASTTSAVADFGVQGSPAHAWLQSRDDANYAINYNLYLNPNGGNVGIGTLTPGGIGTTVPGQRFEVRGSNSAPGTSGTAADGIARFRPVGTLVALDIGGFAGNTWLQARHVNDYSVSNFNLLLNPNAGNVGIGTTIPSQRLHVNGNICAIGSIGACSDERFKHNVEPLDGALDIVQNLRPVRFHWRSAEFPDHKFSAGAAIGFIAQDVEPIVPSIVSTGSDGYKSVDYGRLTPVLVEAMHELRAEKDAEIMELRSEGDAANTELRARVESLEKLVQQLLADKQWIKP